MQQLALEMNLSETATYCQRKKYYHMLWFTPNTEVELCACYPGKRLVLFHELGFPGKNDLISKLNGK
jgi:hypothetical protein